MVGLLTPTGPQLSSTENTSSYFEGEARFLRDFTLLNAEYGGRIRAVALQILNNADDADDVSQQVLLIAHRKGSTYRGESSLGTWLHRVTVNTALLARRKRGRHPQEHLEREESLVDPTDDEALHDLEEHEALDSLLAHIEDDRHRTVLRLHYLQGQSFEQIAEVLRCSVGSVKRLAHEARHAARALLASQGVKELGDW